MVLAFYNHISQTSFCQRDQSNCISISPCLVRKFHVGGNKCWCCMCGTLSQKNQLWSQTSFSQTCTIESDGQNCNFEKQQNDRCSTWSNSRDVNMLLQGALSGQRESGWRWTKRLIAFIREGAKKTKQTKTAGPHCGGPAECAMTNASNPSQNQKGVYNKKAAHRRRAVLWGARGLSLCTVDTSPGQNYSLAWLTWPEVYWLTLPKGLWGSVGHPKCFAQNLILIIFQWILLSLCLALKPSMSGGGKVEGSVKVRELWIWCWKCSHNKKAMPKKHVVHRNVRSWWNFARIIFSPFQKIVMTHVELGGPTPQLNIPKKPKLLNSFLPMPVSLLQYCSTKPLRVQ